MHTSSTHCLYRHGTHKVCMHGLYIDCEYAVYIMCVRTLCVCVYNLSRNISNITRLNDC